MLSYPMQERRQPRNDIDPRRWCRRGRHDPGEDVSPTSLKLCALSSHLGVLGWIRLSG